MARRRWTSPEAARKIDAVITDIIMPRLNGRQLRDELQKLRPDLPVLFMSGHAAETNILKGLVPPNAPFLQKPFTTGDLFLALAALLPRGSLSFLPLWTPRRGPP